MTPDPVHSPVVVISWWSNCLALTCLHSLCECDPDRDILVVQVGKSEAQQAKLRPLLPARVKELNYDAAAPAEHSRVIRAIALEQLGSAAGLWFIDHDVVMRAPLEPWLAGVEEFLAGSDLCLCHAPDGQGPAMTQPAFWMSPSRWPQDIPSIDPVPFTARDSARRPDVCASRAELIMPEQDTLVRARDALTGRGQAAPFPYPFPPHEHLGGLFLFAEPEAPPDDAWTTATVRRFRAFFENCPSEWLAIEEPTLLGRIEAFSEAWHV